jgi:hypothetical protein
MFKKLKSKPILALLTIAAVAILHSLTASLPESAIRSNVVQLVSPNGSCSGEQIKAPSGKTYILTAGHCRPLEKDGSITAINSDGQKIERRIIAEDPKSDLLLLEGLPNRGGLEIASSSRMGDHIRTFTHGAAKAAYKTEGELIQDEVISILVGIIESDKDREQCKSAPKYAIDKVDVFFGLVTMEACVMKVAETSSTAMTVPGSSGGAVVNDRGELVAVVSAGGDGFSYLVRHIDIVNFLAAY